MKKYILITIMLYSVVTVRAQDTVKWSKSLIVESRPYASLTGMTLSQNPSVAGLFLREKGKQSMLFIKGIDLVDENSGSNYFFVEYAYKKVYKKAIVRYSFLSSIAQPRASFDPKFSMSGIGFGFFTKSQPRFEISIHYIVPWQSSKPNIVLRGRAVFQKSQGSFSLNSWYNSGMFGKNTGIIIGVEYLSKNLEISKDIKMMIGCVYNYDVAGNLCKIENPSSKNITTIRMLLWF